MYCCINYFYKLFFILTSSKGSYIFLVYKTGIVHASVKFVRSSDFCGFFIVWVISSKYITKFKTQMLGYKMLDSKINSNIKFYVIYQLN